MKLRTYYALMVSLSLALLILGIAVVAASPISLESVALGMFLIAAGILILLALVHFPPPHMLSKSKSL